MPRPHAPCRCRRCQGDRVHQPRSVAMSGLGQVHVGVMRLCDLEGLDQTAAGARMGVSRGTTHRLLERGRATLVGALIDAKALMIERGASHEDLYPDEREDRRVGVRRRVLRHSPVLHAARHRHRRDRGGRER